MTNNSAILFISDIHYTDNKSKSQLCKDNKNEYYQKWENFLLNLEQKEKIKFKYLVITGDIVDKAQKKEYADILDILQKLCATLKIDKKNILLLPGNHDINRAKLDNYCDENGIDAKKASSLYEIKLENFISFYKEFYQIEEFDVKRAVLNHINITEAEVVIVGVNSLVKESHLETDHIGYIDVPKLRDELEKLIQQGNKNIYVATHHSFTNTGNRELATLENAEVVKETLHLLGINTFIYGHHHTSESKLDVIGDAGETHRYIEIGSLGKVLSNDNGTSYVNRFSLAICKKDEFDLHDYAYMAENWEEVSGSKYVHKLPIAQSDIKGSTENAGELPLVTEGEQKSEIRLADKDVVICEKSDFLIEHLKKDSNYREGHFHWQKGKKTLGWINIAAFLGNTEILFDIKQCIMEMYNQNFNDVQVVLGYGMEGNIIGSSLLDCWIANNVIYHSYPSVHKGDEHIKLEKALWNEYSDFQKVLLICDIMPTFNYINEIINSNDKLKKCTDFYVLSLFCNRNLINSESTSNPEGKINISRFSLAEVNIQLCELDEKDCIVCKEKLKKIYTL